MLRHVLADDPLFQHDPDEIYLWLECIPSDPARGGTKSPDGVELLDGGPIVVQFLDECFLRCARTPYKYLEDLSAMATTPSLSKGPTEGSIIKRPELFPSPVLMTLLEQLSVLVKQNPSPSDLYSLSVFVRRLIFGLAQKTQSLCFIQATTERVDTLFDSDILPGYPRIAKAVRREVRILRACLTGLEGPASGTPWPITDQMQAFLAKLEGTPLGTLFDTFTVSDSGLKARVGSSEEVRKATAVELVDWVRLADHSLHPSEALRLASAMEKLYPPSVKLLAESFHPDQEFFWQLLSNPSVTSE